MPRLALAKLPLEALQGEIDRRAKKARRQLKKFLRQRTKLDEVIAQLQTLAGKPVAALAKVMKGKPGRKPAAKPVVRRKRRKYSVTAEQFILGLVKGKGATSSQINKAWKKAGRPGRADNTLNRLLRTKKVKREKLPKGQKGSTYTLA